MSAICLKQKNMIKTEGWSNVFSSFSTETKSLLFMKQLTTACVSTILYLREILPDYYFESKNFKGMTLKLLNSKKENELVNKIENWLKGAFEAIDKKYLKQLMLDIKDADSKITLEIYTISFNYKKGNEEPNVLLSRNNTAKENFSGFTIYNTKLKTLRLLQMCYAVTQSCRDLPSQITLSIRLSYHENTPKDYQPKGFRAWKPTNPIFPKDTRGIEIGAIETKNHTFKLVNKSCLNDKFFKVIESGGTDSRNSEIQIYEERKVFSNKHKKSNRTKESPSVKRKLLFDTSTICSTVNTPKPLIQCTKKKDWAFTHQDKFVSHEKNTTNHSLFEATDTKNLGKSLQVRCPCQSTEKSKMMFTCLHCKCFTHAECFGVLNFDFFKKIRFNCHLCHQPQGKLKCHDKVMANLKHSSDQQKLAILRRVLKICKQPYTTKITLKKMEKIAGLSCPKNVVQIVLNKMIELGIAEPQKKKKNFLINKTQVSETLFHFFYEFQTSSKVHSLRSYKHAEDPKSKTTDSNLSSIKKQSTVKLQVNTNNLRNAESCDLFD